jgi:hypothetical protein
MRVGRLQTGLLLVATYVGNAAFYQAFKRGYPPTQRACIKSSRAHGGRMEAMDTVRGLGPR